ncbi:MAG: hypothetical protein B6245_13855 [Desulfobacteraceae bacterium 4572_88]|nr:MAG: hypothetical protein B6245_13855 [Desulfobacteraceae bacterium 4572_88]RLC04163.1 MAG: hypothetical protein DRI57_28520 [Deltaproteobacteria bacterium]
MLRQASILILAIILFSPLVHAKMTAQNLGKREKVRYAIDNGILSVYDIPFDTFVKLEMWDEIRFVLEANNRNMIRHTFSGLYYSRPYQVDDTIWVFKNAADDRGTIHVFDSETLDLITELKNKTYSKYDGGVRKIHGDIVISGSSDQDVDTAVIWHTRTNEIQTIKLEFGHYVSSIEVDGDRLYIGSCGEAINTWNHETQEFVRTYSADRDATKDWNKKECINKIKIIDNRLIGVGEKTVFIWDIRSGKLLETYAKILPNAIVTFYENDMAEYKNGRFVIRNLTHGEVIARGRAEKPIEDLIITSEKILADHDGKLLILALRHNRGLLFYDFSSLELLKRINTSGETLMAYKNAIFATDDRNLYKYDVANKDSERYSKFVESIRPEDLVLDEEGYYELLKRLQGYPEIIERSGIAREFMISKKLKRHHSFKYGKIGERLVSPKGNANGEKYKEDVYGYKAFYEVKNLSRDYYLVMLASEWSGEYGKHVSENGNAWDVEASSRRGSGHQVFFIQPYGSKYKNHFDLGEKEPVNFLIYPIKIETVSESYYQNFTKALNGRTSDREMIDRYLRDPLVEPWHDQLRQKKKELDQDKDEKGFWPFR